MRWEILKRRFCVWGRSHNSERDLEDELSTHIELQTRKHVSQGMDPRDAQRLARIEFGAGQQVREECREIDRWRWLDLAVRNSKQCFRFLARNPGFALLSILVLSVGIGSNVAAFTTVDAFLLRALPVHHPDELVQIVPLDKEGHTGSLFSPAVGELQRSDVFQGACSFATSYQGVEVEDTLRSLGTAAFSGHCFETLGLAVQLGRALMPDDDRMGAAPVAVITDSFWQSQFGRSPNVLGRSIRVGISTFRIVGVASERFVGLLLGFPEPIMIPLLQERDFLADGSRRTYHSVNVIARRAPGITSSQALAYLTAVSRQVLEQSTPPDFNAIQRKQYLGLKLTLAPARSGIDYFLRQRFSEPLLAIFGLCVAMLLIACVNLSSLLLARGLNRGREVGIRLALGGSPRSVVGIFFLENLVIVLMATAVGVIVGIAAARSILARGGQMFANFGLQIGFSHRGVLFAVIIVAAVIGAFTLTSLWQLRRLARNDILKRGNRGVLAANNSVQTKLLAVQIALTLVLITVSTLFFLSAKNKRHIDLGLKPHNVAAAILTPRPGGYKDPYYWQLHASAYYRNLLQQIESLPDIVSAALISNLPFMDNGSRHSLTIIDGLSTQQDVRAEAIGVSDGYLKTLGAKLVVGETFRRSDKLSDEPSVILSESLARHLGGAVSLLGHHVRIGTQPDWQRLTVVGVASDMDMSLADPNNTNPFVALINFWQHQTLQGFPVLLIKTHHSGVNAAAIRNVVERSGYEYVERFTTLESEIDHALIENIFLAYLATAFGILALVMAGVGLFGLLSYQVAVRTAEIGVRIALGARRQQIRWLILSQTVRLLAFGTVAGIALTFVAEKLVARLLFRISAYDPPVLLAAISILAATVLMAAWLPGERASRIDPIEALRHE